MANEKNEKKEVAKKKAKGPGLFARIGKFFREVFGEVKKLSWPTKKELASYTLTVLAFIVLMSICLLYTSIPRAAEEREGTIVFHAHDVAVPAGGHEAHERRL